MKPIAVRSVGVKTPTALQEIIEESGSLQRSTTYQPQVGYRSPRRQPPTKRWQKQRMRRPLAVRVTGMQHALKLPMLRLKALETSRQTVSNDRNAYM